MNRIADMIKWMMDNWKPACALIYTIICVFDFVVFPCWVGWHRMAVSEFLVTTQGIDVTLKTNIFDYLYRAYSPYTLSGGGLFHLSFGALLTGVAITAKAKVITDRRTSEDEKKDQ